MTVGEEQRSSEFPRFVGQLVGPEVAEVATALARIDSDDEVLALVGFEIPMDDPETRAGGIQIGTPRVAIALSQKYDLMRAQIDRHSGATLLVAAFDGSRATSWSDTLQGVAYFLGEQFASPRRALLSVPVEAMRSPRQEQFRTQLSQLHVTDVVFTSFAAGLSALPQVLIRCQSPAGKNQARTRVASLNRDARGTNRLIEEITATLAGDVVSYEEVHLAPLPDPSEPWDREHLDGMRADLLDLAAQTDGVMSIEDIVEVIFARGIPIERRSDLPEEPVLMARHVRSPLPNLDDLEKKHVEDRSPRIQAGDVVGKSLGPHHWAVAGEQLSGVAADNGVILLRSRGLVSPDLLAAYLNSSTAQRLNVPVGVAMKHLRRVDLLRMPVPDLRPDDESGHMESLQHVDQALGELVSVVENLRARRDQAFRTFDRSIVMQELREAGDQAQLVRSQLQRQRDEARAFQDGYPHPIARALRVFRQQQDPFARHGAFTRLLEALVITLGSMATAWAHEVGSAVEPIAQVNALVDKWRTGGPSLGHWVAALDGVGTFARKQGQDAFGLAEATRRTKGGRGLISDLDDLVRWRNSGAHGGAPRNAAEAEASVNAMLLTLNSALEGAAGLTGTQWILLHRSDWDRHMSRFNVTAQSLTGDHPDFEWTGFASSVPLSSNLVYVREEKPDSMLLLHPFVTVGVCDTCGNEEIYYVDRLRSTRLVLRSFTTGHVMESPNLLADLSQSLSRTGC